MSGKEMDELLFKSIEEIGQLYRKKEVSPYEITKATIERLNTLEPKLNAFITVLSEEALIQAKKAEDTFVKGVEVGKLYGIPVSLKDIFDTKGIRTSLGSKIMKDYVPTENSHVYDAFSKAGAIIVGKNNMLEFAYGSVHPEYGQCNNPWDINRTAGGSSSGSASSIAAGIGFASIGTDTGGSIRLPSSFCGVVGLKPTYETVSRRGLFNLSHSLDHIGPITRTVRDNAIVLEGISTNQINYDSVFTESIKGMKIGVIRSFIDSNTHSEVEELVASAVEKLTELGGNVVDVKIPGIETFNDIGFPILMSEGSYHHRDWYPKWAEDYAEGTQIVLKEGFSVSAVTYLEAVEKKKEFREKLVDLFENFDVLVSPTSPSPATKNDPSFEDTTYDYLQRTMPFNISGNPAITVPAGLTPSENLPVGLQFIGRHYDESTLYRVADAFQLNSGGYRHPLIY
ncbi:amidase [Virgibacillus byunsanensis]|uniref:Amidase n=1 Tax=Virgibacillus byunsanensis TaxID=570945 RepID=A0ABW3LH27_9BACI